MSAPTVIFFDDALPPDALRAAVAAAPPARVGLLARRPTIPGPGVDPGLVVVAGALGFPLADRRTFAVAAALAGVPPHECAFVSADLPALVAAASAGFQTITATAASPVGAPRADAAAALLAGEVDPDTGPTYILKGHVVTMTGPNDHIKNGRIVVSKGLIRAVLKPNEPVPAEFNGAPVVDTGGTIYPGLLDLHNHFVYNVLPLWHVPKKYDNRSQWPQHDEYKSGVSLPIKKALAKYTFSSAAVIRYVEAKALIGGATTGQGIHTPTRVGITGTRGAMRNAEKTKDVRLPEAGSKVPDLTVSEDPIAEFKTALNKRKAYFYHLSEGTDTPAHKHFVNLKANDLIRASLVGIHVLALERDDLDAMAAAGAKVIWSPFSNLLLYGETLDLKALKASQVTFCLGCDWSPTGSRNLLQELKVADFVNTQQGKPFTSFDLVTAVTAGAAKVVSWHEHLGQLRPGMMADLLVIAGTSAAKPYDHLIAATERDVRLVVVHGVARYGDRALLEKVHADSATELEDVAIAGKPKVFYLRSDEALLNDLTYTEAVERLQVAMADLPGFVVRMEAEGGHLLALGVDEPQELTLELDNEFAANDPLTEYPAEAASLAADDVAMAASIELDGPAVAGDAAYLQRVKDQQNIPAGLADHLKSFYA